MASHECTTSVSCSPTAVESLFPVHDVLIDTHTVQTINGRDLWRFLEVKRQYSKWIREELAAARQQENKDYVVLAVHGYIPKSRMNKKEYHLTLTCCEHLGMRADEAKGLAIRTAFIQMKRTLELMVSRPYVGILRETKAPYTPKFAGQLAGALKALHRKTKAGLLKYPEDMDAPTVNGVVPHRIREGYIAVFGEDAYAEAKRLTAFMKAKATHQMIETYSLDKMLGLMLGFAIAATSETHYQDLIAFATGQAQLSLAIRWPVPPRLLTPASV
jgi:phage anti-repressor protein